LTFSQTDTLRVWKWCLEKKILEFKTFKTLNFETKHLLQRLTNIVKRSDANLKEKRSWFTITLVFALCKLKLLTSNSYSQPLCGVCSESYMIQFGKDKTGQIIKDEKQHIR
jgi:hypothetical protein